MRFELATVTKIIFGAGELKELEKLLPHYGSRALIVTGSKPERAVPLTNLFDAQKIPYSIFSVTGEPTIDDARRGTTQAREFGCDFVAGMGGGAVVDTGKAIAALLTNSGDPLDYLEVIGKGAAIQYAAAPYIAIPTTAGTGAEVTSNAVLASPEHKVKVSLRSLLMLPRLALVDSTLTHSSPPDVTAYSGLDALTQVIEPFVSNKANPVTDAFCQQAIPLAARSLRRAYHQGDDGVAREDMALVSLFGGLALSNAKLGAVHGFAGPFGGMFDAPHGAICARLLPYVMRINIQALREREPQNPALVGYKKIAGFLLAADGVDPGPVKAEDGVEWVEKTCAELQVPPLSRYGFTQADFASLIEKSAVSSSMQGNPIKLTVEEMHQILDAAF
jgi:alcohol dehydrogenase class IV